MKKDTSLNCTCYPAYTGNYTKGRARKIAEITIHHMAGKATAATCGKIFQKVGRKGSAHYGVGYDGKIGQYVNECDTAWSNSNWGSNCQAITIETSNIKGAPGWEVSDLTMKSLIQLVADIAKRNGIGYLIKGINITWHSMYAATACPGPYLLDHIDYIIKEANKINGYEEDDMPRYNKAKDIPNKYWREYCEDLVKRGLLKGDENGNLDITIDMLRIIKITERIK